MASPYLPLTGEHLVCNCRERTKPGRSNSRFTCSLQIVIIIEKTCGLCLHRSTFVGDFVQMDPNVSSLLRSNNTWSINIV